MGQSQYDLGDPVAGLGKVMDPVVDAIKGVIGRRSRELEWQRHQQYKDALKEWEYNKHHETAQTTEDSQPEQDNAPTQESAPVKKGSATPVSAKEVVAEDRKTEAFPNGVVKNPGADTGPRKGRSTFVPTETQTANKTAGPRTPATRSMTTTLKSGAKVTTRVPSEKAAALGKMHSVTETGHSLTGAQRPAALTTPKSPAARKPPAAPKTVK
ncbi:hypothetical protein UFOVP221_68 [uncultured Caudovirales phage]|uniref:Uncharacterized protein n=1 Tax=uncultured Caudovirales phage TaxID=2100421 RepID=A0A6J7WRN3_9CAUD|nr:hypothetical protein UFOVP221_68 [uncultured Caudovirales phage]